MWEKLMELRTKGRARSVNEVLRQLLGLAPPSGSNLQPEPEPSRVAQPSATETVENRSPKPTAESAPPSAGTGAKRRRWSFCPECLALYDHQGKCPSCNVDLIPLDSEENRKMYAKLKRERGRG